VTWCSLVLNRGGRGHTGWHTPNRASGCLEMCAGCSGKAFRDRFCPQKMLRPLRRSFALYRRRTERDRSRGVVVALGGEGSVGPLRDGTRGARTAADASPVPPRWLKAHSTGLHREEFPTCLRRADQILREAPPQMPCSPGSDPGRPLRKLADRDRKEDATGQVGRSPACIVSSHSDLFVTRDEGLESALAEIKPGPRVVRVAEFATLLS